LTPHYPSYVPDPIQPVVLHTRTNNDPTNVTRCPRLSCSQRSVDEQNSSGSITHYNTPTLQCQTALMTTTQVSGRVWNSNPAILKTPEPIVTKIRPDEYVADL